MGDSLKNSSAKGMAWTGMEKIITQGVQFVIGLAIARAVGPGAYGTVGLLAIFMAIAQTFLDSGFGNALIQKKDRNDIDYSTAFIFNVGIALLFYAIFYLSAPIIANFYEQPILKPITRVIALTLVVNSLSLVHGTKLAIELRFKTRSIISIISTFVTGAIGLIMAYRGFGVWALVCQSLSGACLWTIALWITAKWRPHMDFSQKSFNHLFSFGSRLLGASLINTIYNHLYTMVIGKAFSVEDVGFYSKANNIASLPSNIATSMVVNVNYPILARLQDDNAKLITAYKKMLRTPMFVLYPVVVGLIVIAHPLIEILLKEDWLPCVPYLQIIGFGSLLWPLTRINLNLLYVKGRSDLVLKLELIKKPIGFTLLFATIPFGIWWMCIGKATYDLIAFMFNCHYTKKLLGYSGWSQIKELLPIICNCILMAAITSISMHFFTTTWTKLIIGVLIGACSYTLFAFVIKDESLIELMTAIKTKIKHQ